MVRTVYKFHHEVVAAFHLPPFLSAGLLGGSAANEKITPLRSLRLCGEYNVEYFKILCLNNYGRLSNEPWI